MTQSAHPLDPGVSLKGQYREAQEDGQGYCGRFIQGRGLFRGVP